MGLIGGPTGWREARRVGNSRSPWRVAPGMGSRMDARALPIPPPTVPPELAQSATLGLQVLDEGTSVTLRLEGELDLATSGLLQAFLDGVLRSRRTPRVERLVVETAGVGFVDAAGLSPLLHARA